MLREDQKQSLLIVFEKSGQTMSELDDIVHNICSPWRMTICAGAGKLLGDLYISIERIIRLLVEDVYGEKLVKDESWHKRLIDAGEAKGLLPLEFGGTLKNMRNFRHRLMHGYGIDMDEHKLREAIPEAITAYKKVETHIRGKYPELKHGQEIAS